MSLKFEKLEVWQKAIDYSLAIHKITRQFPKEELYILTAQIKRAADSISFNISEGSMGSSNKQFNSFLGHALRSSLEVATCLHLAKKREIINSGEFDKLYHEVIIIIRMIQALRNSITKSITA